MGGNVFKVAGPDGQPSLDVPRMTPEQYRHMKDACVKKLEQIYEYVAVPREAPGKLSHGDVDIHVSKPKRDITAAEVGQLLAAARMDLTGTITNSFAVQLPAESSYAGPQYAQIDVHRAAEGMESWELFTNSYGDLMQMVGKFLRFAGFTANTNGLHVRLPEIEQTEQKKSSLLFLTKDIPDFMAFLGLDYDHWQRGFASQDELFTWCCAGRFFSAKAFESDKEVARDRKRMKKREMFKTFVNDWFPEHVHLCHGQNDRAKLRQQAEEEAVTWFDKHAEREGKLTMFRQSAKKAKAPVKYDGLTASSPDDTLQHSPEG